MMKEAYSKEFIYIALILSDVIFTRIVKLHLFRDNIRASQPETYRSKPVLVCFYFHPLSIIPMMYNAMLMNSVIQRDPLRFLAPYSSLGAFQGFAMSCNP
jgi:ferric iron reductase protein FhuF